MTNKLHWFPLYHDAWIVGTRHMTYKEQGIYLNLLLLQFERGDLSLDVIKRYMTFADDAETELQEILAEKFLWTENGTYRNERMAAVIAEQQGKSQRRSRQTEAARASKQNKSKPVTKPVTATATKPVTERELELELELERERELEVKQEVDPLSCVSEKRIEEDNKPTIEQAVQLWNEKAIQSGSLAQVKRITQARRTKWNRLCEVAGYYHSWCESLERLPVINTKTFQWQPSFDWTLNETNITKLAEGNYGRTENATRETRVSKFING